MGKSSKRKGSHYERKIVRDHEDEGVVCYKVPLSGAMAGYKGDVVVCDELRGEVKARKAANGFKKVRDWLGDNDVLFLQEIGTRHDPSPKALAVLPWDRWLELLRAWSQLNRALDVEDDAAALEILRENA